MHGDEDQKRIFVLETTETIEEIDVKMETIVLEP